MTTYSLLELVYKELPHEGLEEWIRHSIVIYEIYSTAIFTRNQKKNFTKFHFFQLVYCTRHSLFLRGPQTNG